MSRFRLRTLRRVNAEALLIAAGQNLKRLLASAHRRPKEPAHQAAALCPLASSNRGLRHLRAAPRRALWRSAAFVLQQAGPFGARAEGDRTCEKSNGIGV
jgi:hypothetical protein